MKLKDCCIDDLSIVECLDFVVLFHRCFKQKEFCYDL